jgi:hypothetical protein
MLYRYTFLLFAFIIVIVYGTNCNNNTSRTFHTADIENFLKRDSITTKEGNYLVYMFLSENKYKLKWGSKDSCEISKDTFKILGSGLLHISNTSENVILLEQSCGTDCKYGVVLTIKPLSEKVYDFIVANEIKDGLVAYISKSDSSLLTIENFFTGKRQYINEIYWCPAAFKGECIDSVSIKNKELYMKWQGNHWSPKRKDTREKIFKIVI